jgi:hypothetical protein
LGINLDDKDIIYKWKLRGFYSFIKLLIYLLRNSLAGLLDVFYTPLKFAVHGDLAALMFNKKTIERNFFTNSNDLIFFPPYGAHYGDVINLLYFSKSIFETRGKKLTIVSPDNKIAKICKMFEHTDFIYYPALKDKSIYWVKGPLYIFIFGKIRDGHVNFINHNFVPFYEETIGITNLSLFERKLGIKLTMKNVSLPLIDFDAKENLNNKIASLGFVRNKTVLVNIESRAISMNISLNFWKKTINRLVKAGFGVILNNRIEELEGPEVKYLQLDWNELIPAAEYCSNVISIRNGICDLLQFTDTKLIIIYPVIDINGSVQNKFYFKFSQLYLKELMSNPTNLTELAYTPSLEDELISRIVKLIAP